MEVVLSMVHPYTYKLQDGNLMLGPVAEFQERDKVLSNVVNHALDRGVQVVCHWLQHPESIEGAIEQVTFSVDPLFAWTKDQRMHHVVTSKYGVPIPDNPPGNISQRSWENLKKYFTTQSKLREVMGNPDMIIFVGGLLEACVTSAMGYHHQYDRRKGQRVAYIPELCVSLDQEQRRMFEGELEKIAIERVNCAEAQRMFMNGNTLGM